MSRLPLVSLTSDENYLKIFEDDEVFISTTGTDADSTFPADPSSDSFNGSLLITHNIGTIPFVRMFWDPGKNGIWYANRDPQLTIDPWVKSLSTANTTKFIISSGSAQSKIPLFYRIYDLGDKTFTSDSRLDKIFKKDTGLSALIPLSGSSFTLQSRTLKIPHERLTTPIFAVQFSEDNAVWHSTGTKIVGPFDTTSGPPGGPYSSFFYTTAYAYVDDTNLNIVLLSNYALAKTLYARYALDLRS